jgi:NAD+ diphosphatase
MPFIAASIPPAAPSRPHWFVFNSQCLLVDAAGAGIPDLADPESLGLTLARPIFIGTLGTRPCFAAEAAGTPLPPPGMVWEGLRALFLRFDDQLFAAASRASQLVDWERDHRFCGRCATPTTPLPHEHARTCPDCGLTSYPRISPVVMALVKRGRELLLARGPHFPEGMFSALAGFVEAGETAEAALVREVGEEVGVAIANLRYFGSQSWPFPHSLMLAYVCDYMGGDITPQEGEIEAAGWFDAARLPPIPMPASIAGRMIRAVAAELLQHGECRLPPPVGS